MNIFSGRVTRSYLTALFALLTLASCRAGDEVCAGPNMAIRIRATDAQNGQVIGNPSVTAVVIDSPNGAEVNLEPGDSTVVQIFGHAGTYEVTVKKTGFTDVTRRITVQGTAPCGVTGLVELTVPMSRAI